jgi:hypothetical protein
MPYNNSSEPKGIKRNPLVFTEYFTPPVGMNGFPPPPPGFIYIIDNDGDYMIDNDGDYSIAPL